MLKQADQIKQALLVYVYSTIEPEKNGKYGKQ